jgi:HEAT repeat protein
MAARASLDEKLAGLRELRGQVLTAEHKSEVRKRIGDRSNLVVAAAAATAGENTLVEMAGELVQAFERFLVNPLKDDKLCRAKIAIVQALDRMEYQDPEVFHKAARHVQHEPVWGGTEDTATALRAAGLVALARIEGVGCLPLLVDAMIDPAKDVRVAAAVALGAIGGESAALLLRLKARLGDREPDVLSECLYGLMMIDPREYLAFVTEFLEPDDALRCEAAALALGKSRVPEALEPLRACWEQAHAADLRQQLLLAIAILRRPAAIEFLVELVASEVERNALAALSALKIYRYDPALRERLAKLVVAQNRPAVRAAFERDFRPEE